jgi:hypothetical protein
MAGPTVLFQTGNHAGRPAADSGCVLYWCTEHDKLYRSDGATWADLYDYTGVAPGSHVHSGADITSGTVAEARIHADISRDSELAAHTGDTSDAHDASAISVLDTAANFAGTDVEAVLAELQDNIDAIGGATPVGEGMGLVSASTAISAGATTLLDITSEDDDDDGWHQPDTTAISGTVTKTASSLTLTGSGTSFLSQLSPGHVLSVPGTATEILAVRSVESDTSLTLWNAPANTASGQTATRKREYFVVPEGKTGRYLYVIYVTIGTEATPTHVTIGQLAQQTNSVTISAVQSAGGSPSANSNGVVATLGRRRTFTQGEIYALRGVNNNDASVTIQVFFSVTRVA